MRVLFFVDAVLEDAPGGSRVVAQELARGLIERGHAVTMLAARLNTDSPDEQENGNLRIVRLPNSSPAAFVRAGYAAARRLWTEDRYDLLHTHFAYAALGPLAALPSSVPHVRSFHGPWHQEAWMEETQGTQTAFSLGAAHLKRTLRKRVETANLRRSAAVIVLSEPFRKEVTALGCPAARTHLLPGGADTQHFVPAKDKAWVRQSLGLPQNRPLLLSIRRLTPRMGLDNLLQAMPAVIARHPDVLLLVGGDGPERARLKGRIAELALTHHVQMLGIVSEDRLAAYYQAADAFVLPTVALEGFGLVTAESLACGTPVLGTPVGATPALLRRLDRRLLLPGTAPQDLADGIILFLEQGARWGLTPDHLHRFVRAHFSWEAHVRGVEQVYEAVLAGGGHA